MILLKHPFELPIQKLTAYCVTERPFPPHQSNTPGTTLAGAFGSFFVRATIKDCPYNG
jgi:hypothetical protein